MLNKYGTLEFAYTPVNGDNTKLECQDGWYHVILGAFNILNKDNIYYELGDVREMIDNPKNLICQRLRAGSLYGEMEHPTNTPGMTGEQILANNLKIDGNRVSHVIRKIELTPISNNQKSSPFRDDIWVVTAWIKPTGPYGHLLKESLDDPYQNTSFSIRSLVKNVLDSNGNKVRQMMMLITWDWVKEPGIRIADKNSAVSFNGKTISNGQDLEVCHIDMEELKKYVATMAHQNNVSVMGNESVDDYKRFVEYTYNKYCVANESVFLGW